jgi:lipoprotein-anchoring transpeptidase ErfK/SrfK
LETLLPGIFRHGLLCVFALASMTGIALAQTQSFDEMIEDVLKRHPPGAAPTDQQAPVAPDAEPAPPDAFPSASEAVPAQPAPGQTDSLQPPLLEPVSPIPPALLQNQGGPKAYTPPKLAKPRPNANATAAQADQALGASTTPGTESTTSTAAERTRESLTPEEVNAAVFVENALAAKGANPLILKVQVLLDRAGASPGAIDAYSGGNLSKALAAVETVLRLPADGVLSKAVWDALGGDQSPPVLVQYTITPDDLAYPFTPVIPTDFAEQSKLPNLNYTTPEEMFGERFHMDVKLLLALNPNANFRQAGSAVWVADVSGPPIAGKVARIVADKTLKQVRGYDAQDRLLVAYPATIGSPDNPSPSGELFVRGVASNPVYYYDPRNFVQGENAEKLQLPPGPNNPVGSVWIDLTEPTYGIHGTPEPTKIDKTGSHGCVRLTNWDAEELSKLVDPGVPVSFTE